MSGAASGSSANASTKSAVPAPETPLISERYIDAPSQRLYILSIGLLCQAIKVFDWLYSLVVPNSSTSLTFKWALVDAIYCLTLKRLRIPRLNYAVSVVFLQIILLCLVDGVLFGSVQIGVSHYSLTSSARDLYQREFSSNGRLTNLRDMLLGDEHLKGEHTVRMSPISTAKLNPNTQSFCLGPPSNYVLVPVLLNNTKPSHVRYAIQALGSDNVEFVDLNSREMKAIESARLESLHLTKISTAPAVEEYDEDDWDAEDEIEASPSQKLLEYPDHGLERTQGLTHLKISKPGVIRLDRVLDSSSSSLARILLNEVSIVPCPQASFVSDRISSGDNIRCLASNEELVVRLFGVPPLSLKWYREINGRREHFSVDKVDGEPGKEGQAQELLIPLVMPLNTAGEHLYVLNQITDGLENANVLSASPSSRKAEQTVSDHLSRTVTVLRRAAVSFRECGPGKPTSLLIDSEAQLQLSARDIDPLDSPLDVTFAYRPSPSTSNKSNLKPWEKVISYPAGKASLTVDVSSPGDYTIVKVKGKSCPGDVLSPDTCKVNEEPHPSAEIEWKRIHECSGDTGVSAYLVLHGKPPFQVHYTQKRNSEPQKEMTRTFQGSRGDITLQPENSGTYTYTFTHLSDANYRRVHLDGPSISQVVHPLASANFVFHSASGTGNKRAINSCAGNTVDIEIDLRGDSPWNLEIQVAGPKGSETIRKTGLRSGREKLQIPIPPIVDEEGGTFQIDLVSVEDAHGCQKALAVPGMSVNVRRIKPSARFYSQGGQRTVIALENERVRLPLRLTGEGPWRVKYQRVDPSGQMQTAVLQSPNDYISVNQRGVFKLVEVVDSQCPGSVSETESDYSVEWISRPTIKLSPGTDVKHDSYNGSFIRAPICEARDDYVDLELTGRPPFQVLYNVARQSDAGETRILEQPTVSSVQPRTRIQLLTTQAGRIFYEIKQIGDANYPLAQNKEHVIPRNERLLFEQSVVARPSARFKKLTRLSHCLRDPFVPSDSLTGEDVVLFEGQAPFYLELSIKNLATSHIHRETVEIQEPQWRLNLPNYVFSSIGPHLVTIESVRDSSGCDQAAPDPLKTSIWVDVAESAAIVPYDRREHFCVGDISQFQMEGSPPWTVGYKVNRKYHEQIAKQSPLVLVQQHPGNISIVSISHQHKMCKTTVENIDFQVHALPAAQVAHGRDYFEDIHEGAQAHIVFTLVGEPPFTFTYQRSEPPARKGAKPGKILETHTVSGITTHEYSIYSALEGTWTVSFISDKYCRYPPVQPDNVADKTKS